MSSVLHYPLIFAANSLISMKAFITQQFLLSRDVFVALPTRYGKSLRYFTLPSIFDHLRTVTNQSLVFVVSPLVALMKDQVTH